MTTKVPEVLKMISLNRFAASLLATGSLLTATISLHAQCDKSYVLGKWMNNGEIAAPGHDKGFTIKLDFNSDGHYSYWIGTGNQEWLTHTGAFFIGPTPPGRTNAPNHICTIVLKPYANSIKVERADVLGLTGRPDEQRTKIELRKFGFLVDVEKTYYVFSGEGTQLALDTQPGTPNYAYSNGVSLERQK
jgi:hypothetical protein